MHLQSPTASPQAVDDLEDVGSAGQRDPPLPPLASEGLEAVRVLAAGSSEEAALINAARTLSLFHESAACYSGHIARHLGDQRLEVRKVMAYALGQLGVAAASLHAREIVECLEDADADTCTRYVLQNILQSTGQTGADALAAKVAAGTGLASKSAMQILPSMGSQGAAALAAQLPHESAAATQRIVATLMRSGKAAASHLHVVAGLLDHADAGVRTIALEAIGRAGEAGAPYAAPVAKLLKSSDASVRCASLEALQRLGDGARAHTSDVASALFDRDVKVQERALKAVGGMAKASLKPNPLTDFDEGCWDLSDDGLSGLIQHISRATPGALDAAKNLGCLGAAALAIHMQSKRKDLRKRCLQALVQMGPRAPNDFSREDAARELHVGAGALAIFLENKDPALRTTVCRAFGTCGCFARGHAMTLKKLWDGNGDTQEQDPSADVRRAAMLAITCIDSNAGGERNVLLTDPTIIALSIPSAAKRDATRLVELIRAALERLKGIAASGKPLPPDSVWASARCCGRV